MVECIAYCAVKTFLISVRLTRENVKDAYWPTCMTWNKLIQKKDRTIHVENKYIYIYIRKNYFVYIISLMVVSRDFFLPFLKKIIYFVH